MNYFMGQALKEAEKALRKNDVPVGAVIVKDGVVISKGHNMRHAKKDALLHAEAAAIQKACRKLESSFLDGCEMYVTLEPCPMCAGAIIQARIKRLYFGAYDPKAGCAGSVTDLFTLPFSHRMEYYGGIMEDECAGILKKYFEGLRTGKNEKA